MVQQNPIVKRVDDWVMGVGWWWCYPSGSCRVVFGAGCVETLVPHLCSSKPSPFLAGTWDTLMYKSAWESIILLETPSHSADLSCADFSLYSACSQRWGSRSEVVFHSSALAHVWISPNCIYCILNQIWAESLHYKEGIPYWTRSRVSWCIVYEDVK